MFTGIVEEIGKIEKITRIPQGLRFEIACEKTREGTKIGDSIAVDGVCLTVVAGGDIPAPPMKPGVVAGGDIPAAPFRTGAVGAGGETLVFEAISETLTATTLKFLTPGSSVNLERALCVGDRLGGHFVTGHVDCVGVIRSRAALRGNLEFRVGVPARFLKFLAHRGSVAFDGISLTIADVRSGSLRVCIIPHTAAATTLVKKHAGSRVNVEFDMLMKRPSQS